MRRYLRGKIEKMKFFFILFRATTYLKRHPWKIHFFRIKRAGSSHLWGALIAPTWPVPRQIYCLDALRMVPQCRRAQKKENAKIVIFRVA
jgi:hypothetical protein